MIVNGQEIKSREFAYDGCHKIYLIEDVKDRQEAISTGYIINPIMDLPETFESSCELRFISNWKLTKRYVQQFEKAVFQ